jgi:hypothetical protein
MCSELWPNHWRLLRPNRWQVEDERGPTKKEMKTDDEGVNGERAMHEELIKLVDVG